MKCTPLRGSEVYRLRLVFSTAYCLLSPHPSHPNEPPLIAGDFHDHGALQSLRLHSSEQYDPSGFASKLAFRRPGRMNDSMRVESGAALQCSLRFRNPFFLRESAGGTGRIGSSEQCCEQKSTKKNPQWVEKPRAPAPGSRSCRGRIHEMAGAICRSLAAGRLAPSRV